MAAVTIENRNLIARLWGHQETRSVIVQIVTVAVVFALLALVLRNVAVNLEAIGKEFSFGFLTAPAAYDITFSPFIEYSSRDTHLRASAVGILNTLLVAVCGIVAATVLGVTMGILRLSRNWLVNRIVYVFLEFTRNVPVLLHILLVHGIVVTTLPAPKQAIGVADTMFFSQPRGLRPVAGAGGRVGNRDRGAPRLDRRGRAVPPLGEAGAGRNGGRSIPCSGSQRGSSSGSPGSRSSRWGRPSRGDIPALKGFNFRGGMALKPEFLALWLALTYYTACFIAEIVRAGILAVSHGQSEAAYALGLRPNRNLQLVVLPQALRIIVPPLVSQYLNLTKNSSLAIADRIHGHHRHHRRHLPHADREGGRDDDHRDGVYLIISLLISFFMNWFNRSIRLQGTVA